MQICKCRGCGAAIVWIKTPAGKNMPCEAGAVYYRRQDDAPGWLVLSDGSVVHGVVLNDLSEHPTGTGYIPHWSTCPQAESFKRKRG